MADRTSQKGDDSALYIILFLFSLIALGFTFAFRFPDIFFPPKPGQPPNPKIPPKYLGYTAVILSFLLIGSVLGIKYDLQKAETESASIKPKPQKAIITTDYKGKKQEILDAFNDIMINNNAKMFYVDVKHSNPDKLTVYVKRTYLLDSQIKDFSNQCATVWKGITWARIHSSVILDNFELEIVDKDSEKILNSSKFYEKPE